MSKDGERVNEITFSAVWRSVPPSSITRPESAKGEEPHAVMSSVPPEWMITGTGCEEIARSGYRVEAVESITTLPPKISTPPSMRWSVWLFAMVSVAAPFLTSFAVPLSGGKIVTLLVSFETSMVPETYIHFTAVFGTSAPSSSMRSCMCVDWYPSSNEPPFFTVSDLMLTGFDTVPVGTRKIDVAPSITKSTFGMFTAFLWKYGIPPLVYTVPPVVPVVLQNQKPRPAVRSIVRVWPFSSNVVAA